MDRWRKAGFLEPTAEVDLVAVHKRTAKGLRAWALEEGTRRNTLEGHPVYLDRRTVLLSCTGAATLSPQSTAEPCLLVVERGNDPRRVTRAYFSLAQLNYSAPAKAHRLAHPLRETDSLLERRKAEDPRGVR
jgi:hypothetical protein